MEDYDDAWLDETEDQPTLYLDSREALRITDEHGDYECL